MSVWPVADTNVLLRFLLRDHPEQSPATKAFMDALAPLDRLIVLSTTVSELVFVASGRTYGVTRAEIADLIGQLLAGPFELADRETIAVARDLYRDVHDDWDDCVLAAYALEEGDGTVVSFDRGLDRIPGLTRIEPLGEAAL